MKAMISSTMRDLPEYRQVVRDACISQRVWPIMMEHHIPAQDHAADDVSMGMVAECDVYLGIFAHSYGSCPENDARSYTEIEYDEAVKLGIPVIPFFVKPDYPWNPQLAEQGPKAESLKQLMGRVAEKRIVKWFTSPENLHRHVLEALVRFQSEREKSNAGAEKAGKPDQVEDFVTPAFDVKPPVVSWIGRDTELERLTQVFAKHPARAAVYGGPGLGKTTLCSRLLDQPSIRGVYVKRIFWHSLRAEETLLDLLASIGRSLGLESLNQEAHLSRAIIAECNDKITFLCLDHIEQVLTGRDSLQCSEFLLKLLSLPNLSLLVTSRSQQPPLPEFSWDLKVHVLPLESDKARDLFLSYVGSHCLHMEELPALLADCGGVPLAIRLLAQQARSLKDLRSVRTLWQQKGVAFLANRHGESLGAVLVTALSHPWIHANELNAMRAVGFSPMGVARSLFDAARYQGLIAPAVATLSELGLVEGDSKTVYLLPPVREFVMATIRPYPELEKSLAIKCWTLFESIAKRVGSPRGAEAVSSLRHFLPNIRNALRHGLRSDAWHSAAVAVANIARPAALGMLDLRDVCTEALARVRIMAAQFEPEARGFLLIGLLRASSQQAESANDFRGALIFLKEALELVEGVASKNLDKARARVHRDLGDVYLDLDEYELSIRHLEKAESIFAEQKADREIDNCRLSRAEWELKRDHLKSAGEIIETVIAACERRTRDFEITKSQGFRPDSERIAGKAYLLRCQKRAARDAPKALADLIRAAKLFGSTGDVRRSLVVGRLHARLLAGSQTADELRERTIKSLIPKPNQATDRARGRLFEWVHRLLAQSEVERAVRAEHETLAGMIEARLPRRMKS